MPAREFHLNERYFFFEQCPVPIAVAGFDGYLRDVNPAWARFVGWSRAELVGRPLKEFIDARDLARAVPDPTALWSGGMAGAWEGRFLCKDGEYRPLAWDVAAMPERSKYYCVARQVSGGEGKQGPFGQGFIRAAAHGLNTPLTPIQITLSTMRRRLDAAADPAGAKTLDLLDRNFGRLCAEVATLLDALLLQARSMPLRFAAMDLAGLIRDTVATNMGVAELAGIRLLAPPGEFQLPGDRARLSQVLHHYVSAALSCATRGATVRVEVEREGPDAVVKVIDETAGFSTEQRRNLFAPQAENAIALVGSPVGLGLHVARGIVEMHGGRVACNSPGPGQGAELSFTLPLQREQKAR